MIVSVSFIYVTPLPRSVSCDERKKEQEKRCWELTAYDDGKQKASGLHLLVVELAMLENAVSASKICHRNIV